MNSNVGIEWGWAGALLGNDCLIGVMNTAYGGPEMLPVDIHPHLLSVKYALNERTEKVEIKAALNDLAGKLEKAVLNALRLRFFGGLHREAPAVVEYLIRSADDLPDISEWSAPDLAKAAQVSEDSALAIMEDLTRAGLMTTEDAGYCGSDFMVRALPSLFVHFDPLFMGWNADGDARQLAQELVARDGFMVQPISDELGWAPRRMNPALYRIVMSGGARASSEGPGALPFLYVELHRNEYTRAFAEGRATLPPVAPRAQFQIDR